MARASARECAAGGEWEGVRSARGSVFFSCGGLLGGALLAFATGFDAAFLFGAAAGAAGGAAGRGGAGGEGGESGDGGEGEQGFQGVHDVMDGVDKKMGGAGIRAAHRRLIDE